MGIAVVSMDIAVLGRRIVVLDVRLGMGTALTKLSKGKDIRA